MTPIQQATSESIREATRLDTAAAAEADSQWRIWRARGAEGDRRRATVVGRVVVVIAIGLAIWLLVLVV